MCSRSACSFLPEPGRELQRPAPQHQHRSVRTAARRLPLPWGALGWTQCGDTAHVPRGYRQRWGVAQQAAHLADFTSRYGS